MKDRAESVAVGRLHVESVENRGSLGGNVIPWRDVQRVQHREVVIAPGAISFQRPASLPAPPVSGAPSNVPRVIPSRRLKIAGGELGTRETLEAMTALAVEASRDPQLIDHARALVSGLPNKAYKDEAERVYEHVRNTVRYVHDPIGLETITDPRWLMFVIGAGDCFVRGTKVLKREGHGLVPIESLRTGDEIWGRDRWSRVERVWSKGQLATWVVRLNNGSNMRLTPDHKVWVARCPHDHQNRTKSRPCSCRMDKRELVVMHVSDLRPGMALVQPDGVDYGTGEMDPDRAYVEGLYVSDGWCEGSRFHISGRDGFPKEQQKREVERICTSLGIATSMHEKHISVFDRDWSERMASMGKHATAKRLLSLNLAKETADRLTDGVLADAGKNHRGGLTFSTTSRELMLQVRVLLKQRGITCGTAHVIDHGGLGTNPIWRLYVRGWSGGESVRGKSWSRSNMPSGDCRTPRKLLRVREVIPDGLVLPCVDIQTDDKNVWLPEADWTVHNCDDHSTLVAALALALGLGAAFRTVAADCENPDPKTCPWVHVYPVLGIPRGNAVEWVAADTTQLGGYFGWEPPRDRIKRVATWVIAGPAA